MKKYIYTLFAALLTATALTSCSEDEGTEPGNDSTPNVVIYQYTAASPYNPDNDIYLRLASNSAVREVYYLAELTATMEENLSSMGEEGYMNYVIENGTQITEINGTADYDLYITGLIGEYTITVVAVNGNTKTYQTAAFTGLSWETYGTGYWTDGILAAMFGQDPVTMSVYLDRAVTANGVRFRFSSPYDHASTAQDELGAYNGYPSVAPEEIVEGENLFVISCTGSSASMAISDLGLDWGYGAMYTGTLNGNVQGGSTYPLGTYDEEAGSITFPASSLLLGMGSSIYAVSLPSTLYLNAEAYQAAQEEAAE